MSGGSEMSFGKDARDLVRSEIDSWQELDENNNQSSFAGEDYDESVFRGCGHDEDDQADEDDEGGDDDGLCRSELNDPFLLLLSPSEVESNNLDNNLVLPDNYSSSNLFSSVFENSTSSNNNIDGESLLDEQDLSLLGFNFSLCLIPEVIQTSFQQVFFFNRKDGIIHSFFVRVFWMISFLEPISEVALDKLNLLECENRDFYRVIQRDCRL